MSIRNRLVLGAGALLAVSAIGRSPVASMPAVHAQGHDASVGITKRNIYPSVDEASADVKAALAKARREHKRVLMDFGGDWCPDCQVLNIYFGQEPNADLLAKNFVRVNVNIGHEDANVELAKRYGVPLKGVPALAVVDPDGKVVYSQSKEFSDMRHMEPGDLTAFLNKWKR